SDFDGGIATPVDAAHLAKITEALVCEAGPGANPDLLCQGVCAEPGCAPVLRPLDRPFPFDDGPGGGLAGGSLSKIMGENVARVLDEVLGCNGPPCAAAPAAPRRRHHSGCTIDGDATASPYDWLPVALLLVTLRLTARPARRRYERVRR
ncbi:MAG: hypothetical protein KC466_14645, partial [Myxococcales bacterium]|nr:hypothetical protein [Myxococcales bacterium]